MNLLDDVYRRARLLKQQTAKRYLWTTDYDVGPVALLVSHADYVRIRQSVDCLYRRLDEAPVNLKVSGVLILSNPEVPDFKETP